MRSGSLPRRSLSLFKLKSLGVALAGPQIAFQQQGMARHAAHHYVAAAAGAGVSHWLCYQCMQLFCGLTGCWWWCAGARSLNLRAVHEPAPVPGRSASGGSGQGHHVHPHRQTMKTTAWDSPLRLPTPGGVRHLSLLAELYVLGTRQPQALPFQSMGGATWIPPK